MTSPDPLLSVSGQLKWSETVIYIEHTCCTRYRQLCTEVDALKKRPLTAFSPRALGRERQHPLS